MNRKNQAEHRVGLKKSVGILILDDQASQLKKIARNITSHDCKYAEFNINIVQTETSQNALSNLKRDGTIQVVLMDWYLYEPDQGGCPENEKIMQSIWGSRLIKEIGFIRPEVSIFIISAAEDSASIIQMVDVTNVSFIHKNEISEDPQMVLDKLMRTIITRMHTPFWTEYKEYTNFANDTWHTPGHSGGSSFVGSDYLKDFYYYFGENYFRGDLSVSVDELGSLLESSKFIGEAQTKAAKTFGVKHTYFATNGSSTANKIVIQTLLKPNEKVIVDRNCHKSVHYGIIMSGAIPVYLESKYIEKYGIFAPPSIQEILTKINGNTDAKLLVVTGCTYDGFLLDINRIVENAHKKKIKVFVDEAWFAYASFHPDLRKYSAVLANADYITHSAHKVLSAFSQASLIHVNDPDFDEKYFKENYYIYTSTSPQYTMIASLDVACMQMEMEGYKKINEVIKIANNFRKYIGELQNIKVVGLNEVRSQFQEMLSDDVGHDPLKVLLDFTDLARPMREIHNYLKERGGMEIEKTTHNTMLILFTIGTTNSKVTRLIGALRDLDRSIELNNCNDCRGKILTIPLPVLEKAPRDSFLADRKLVPIQDSLHMISSFLVTPYPPGIPLLVPGQKIEQEHINYLFEMIEDGVEVHGIFEKQIHVVL